jgi:hypothetical protein
MGKAFPRRGGKEKNTVIEKVSKLVGRIWDKLHPFV